MQFEILHQDRGSQARVGRLVTPHGVVETPAFVPLATKATVKSLTPDDLHAIGAQIVLGNTYHLYLRPGPEVMARLGGLHRFMGWDGPILTDSGGFQVFSMGHGHVADEIKGRRRLVSDSEESAQIVRIDEEGVVFKSYLDGSLHQFTPEKAIQVQKALGSDIALVLDECTPYHVTYDYTKAAMERTHRWALRCLTAFQTLRPSPSQALFGIVQGGVYPDLREIGARFIASLPFDGYAIGGSLGQDKAEMYRVVSWVTPHLPEERPRHLLGIGEIDDLLECVALGIDLFDCAMPTRLGRHGGLLVRPPQHRWRIDITRSEYAQDPGPVEPSCSCSTCRSFSRAYLHHLFKNKEVTGIRLATLHNLAFLLRIVGDIRRSILEGRFAEFREELLGGG